MPERGLVRDGIESAPKADDAERRRGEELKGRQGPDLLLGPVGEIYRAIDRLPERVEAEVVDREPDLQRPRAARELHAAISEVDLIALVVGEVIGVDRERLLEAATVAHEHAAALDRLVKPLVWIKRHRIGALDAGQRLATPLGQRGEPTVGGIDMEPQTLVAAEVGEGVQRIDGAGVRRAGVGRDDQGVPAGLGVGIDRAGQRIEPDPMGVIRRQHAQLVGTEADQPGGSCD